MTDHILEEVEGLYRIIKLKVFRRTPGVYFDLMPMQVLPHIDSIDKVIHENSAISPGSVNNVERPWYMHTYQDDNLMVMHGTRFVEIYTPKHGKVENFTVTTNQILKNGQVVFDGSAMLVWPRYVFHRIKSLEDGSASVNFAVHYEGFDIKTNFNVYDLDTATGKYTAIREGWKDQING